MATPWHERAVCTPDEQAIKDWLHARQDCRGRTILHVGVGNSSVARDFPEAQVDGIAFYDGERAAAERWGLPNYRVYEVDKYSADFRRILAGRRFDLIIDPSTNSYAPNYPAFLALLAFYREMLLPDGLLLIYQNGLLYAMGGCPAMTPCMVRHVAIGFTLRRYGRVITLQPRQEPPSRSQLRMARLVGRVMNARAFRAMTNSHWGQMTLTLLLKGVLLRRVNKECRRIAIGLGWRRNQGDDVRR